jgi:hypothetical protein
VWVPDAESAVMRSASSKVYVAVEGVPEGSEVTPVRLMTLAQA